MLGFAWATLYINMALHEMGHALACSLLGGRVARLNIGGSPTVRIGIISLGPWPWRGWVDYERAPATGCRRALVSLAGPASNILVALSASAGTHWARTPSHCSALFVLACLAAGLANLLPLHRFDGTNALRHGLSDTRVSPAAIDRGLAQLQVLTLVSLTATVVWALRPLVA